MNRSSGVMSTAGTIGRQGYCRPREAAPDSRVGIAATGCVEIRPVTALSTSGPAAVSPSTAIRPVDPAHYRPHLLQVGVIVWLASELMFFSGLFAAFFSLRADTSPWPPHGDKLDVPPVLVATILLVLSSFTMQYGVHRAIRGSKWGFLGWLALTFALGGLFEGLQISDYLGRDFGIDTNAYGSAFYTLTGFHFLHVLGRPGGHDPHRGPDLEDPPVRAPHHAGDRVPVLLLALRGRGVDRPVPRHLRAQMTVPSPAHRRLLAGPFALIALADRGRVDLLHDRRPAPRARATW